MTIDVQRLLDDALRLPDQDRAELAGLLIDSLDEGQDADVQAAWSEEIARRLEELNIAAARFLEELDVAVADIQARRDCGAPYLHRTRCYLLRRFPYLVVYRVRE